MAALDGGGTSWVAGNDVEVTLALSEAVTVDTTSGTPSMGMTEGSNTRTAAYASGTGTSELVFAYRTTEDDGAVSAVSVTASSLALNGAAIRDGTDRRADLAHPGAELTLSAPQVVALTAAFSGLPSAHDGESAFSLSLTFGEEVAFTGAVLQGANGDAGALTVAGGAFERVIQVEPGSSRAWTLRITPAGDGAVTVTLPASASCEAALAGAVTATVAGPSAPATGALTATFESVPAAHGGPGSEPFAFRVRFSEGVPVPYRVLQGPHAFDVSAGSVTKSGQVDGRDELRWVHVQPAGWDDVTVTLEPNTEVRLRPGPDLAYRHARSGDRYFESKPSGKPTRLTSVPNVKRPPAGGP